MIPTEMKSFLTATENITMYARFKDYQQHGNHMITRFCCYLHRIWQHLYLVMWRKRLRRISHPCQNKNHHLLYQVKKRSSSILKPVPI